MHGNVTYGKFGWITLGLCLLLVVGAGIATSAGHVNASNDTTSSETR
jgi:hypothetical protein